MDETTTSPVILDTLIQSRQLQMLKAVVPYISSTQQKTFSILIKTIELQKTLQLFTSDLSEQTPQLQACSNEPPSERICHMLQAMRSFCTPKERENLDLLLNYIEIFSNCETLFT